jgi:uncharacterized protein (TIGR04255 family)
VIERRNFNARRRSDTANLREASSRGGRPHSSIRSARNMRNVDIFRLWSQSEYKHNYPAIEEYGAMPEFRELFGVKSKKRPLQRFVFGPTNTVLRYNFRNADRREQIQIQRDRFAFYWQSGWPRQEYPRFPALLETFKREYRIFEEFVREKGWGEVVPNQCAIAYTNNIPKGDGWESLSDLGKVVTVAPQAPSGPLPNGMEMEDIESASIFTASEAGRPNARVYVILRKREPQPDEPSAVELELVVRGAPSSTDANGVVKFFERGRQLIVKTFDSITTETADRIWGKQ